MKTFLALILAFAVHSLGISQNLTFVHPDNLWYSADKCYSSGNWYISIYAHQFTQTIRLDTQDYYILETDGPDSTPLFEAYTYYREETGRVYARSTTDTAEQLIYDFNLSIGDTFLLKGNDFTNEDILLLTTAIDSIELSTGQKRKRLRLNKADNPQIGIYWIEGLGGQQAPLNPSYSFVLDCWNELSCFHQNGDTLYSPGTCETGNFDIVSAQNLVSQRTRPLLFPNPVLNVAHIQLPDDSILQEKYQVYLCDSQGRRLNNWSITANDIHLEQLAPGVYYINLKRKTDGESIILRCSKL